MQDDAHPANSRPGRPRARRPRRLAAALIVVGLVVAACSSGGGSKGSTTGSSSSSGSSTSRASSAKPGALAYAQCMRAHGLADFPDPGANGSFNFTSNGGSSDLDPSSPQMQAAQQACKSVAPPGAVQGKDASNAMLKYAQCMRAHGIKDFPDPSPNGGLQMQNPGGDLDPSNPQFQAAQQACKSLAPGAGQTVTNGNGGGA